ncbi:MAG: formylmethanofuran dehydrogenase subunit E family protein [Methanotrichaceae archaeon]|nr:formylmethanofuran dehydrogenase subunit E family protein [Methanotrichaceae archaeon]
MKMKEIDVDNISLEQMVERGIEFHGHLGPFLVLGIRMGLRGLKELGSFGYSGIVTNVEAGTTPPLSCLVDGLQIATGCTMGKGNILTHPLGLAQATIETEGRKVTMKVKDEILDQIQALGGEGIEEYAWRIADLPDEALFELV